jgi:hypothetical protein
VNRQSVAQVAALLAAQYRGADIRVQREFAGLRIMMRTRDGSVIFARIGHQPSAILAALHAIPEEEP